MRKEKNELLGSLEKQVMEIVWKRKEVSVREVCDAVNKKRKTAYTTIMTVMSRLNDKGILSRKKLGDGSYAYAPKKQREDFYAHESREVIDGLIRQCGEVAVAQFIDAVEKSDISDLAEWQKKLKKIQG